MAEFLVNALAATHADPETDRAGCYKVGDIVLAQPDGHGWGDAEGPGKFVIVKVPGLALGAASARAEPWGYEYDVQVMQRNVALDGWRFRVVNLQRRADGAASPTRALLRDFFEPWGATFVRLDADGVVVDWRIVSGVTSVAFLGGDPASAGVALAETAYDSASGWHTVTVDWSASAEPGRMGLHIMRRVTSLGGEILSTVGSTAMCRLQRDRVRDEFVEYVKGARRAYKRRRYSLSAADVAAALAAGGVLTMTPAGLAASVIDHRA